MGDGEGGGGLHYQFLGPSVTESKGTDLLCRRWVRGWKVRGSHEQIRGLWLLLGVSHDF